MKTAQQIIDEARETLERTKDIEPRQIITLDPIRDDEPMPARERGLDTRPFDVVAFVRQEIASALAHERRTVLPEISMHIEETREALAKQFEDEVRELRVLVAELRVANAELKAAKIEMQSVVVDLPNPLQRH